MRIAVPKETLAGEKRVAVVPDSVKRMAAKKIEVSVETHAGDGSLATDDDYKQFGATIEDSAASLFS